MHTCKLTLLQTVIRINCKLNILFDSIQHKQVLKDNSFFIIISILLNVYIVGTNTINSSTLLSWHCGHIHVRSDISGHMRYISLYYYYDSYIVVILCCSMVCLYYVVPTTLKLYYMLFQLQFCIIMSLYLCPVVVATSYDTDVIVVFTCSTYYS